MGFIRYVVKARDSHGSEYIHTFTHPASKEDLAAGPQQGLAFMQDVVSTYEDEVMSAAPFRCALCGLAAVGMFHMPTAHLEPADPVIFDIPIPYCGDKGCEKLAMMRARNVAQPLGQGSGSSGPGTKCCPGACAPQKHKDLSHLADIDLKACVICGDSVNLQRLGRCQIIPYCSLSCQKRHWSAHKKVCRATAKQAHE